jgi:hypothetical protein
MTTTLANQLPRINLANGGSMQSAQVVTLKSGQQKAYSVSPTLVNSPPSITRNSLTYKASGNSQVSSSNTVPF